MRLLYILIISFFATGGCFAAPLVDSSLVGVWQDGYSRYAFGEDGGLVLWEDGDTYQLRYEFDGALLYEYQRDGVIEYVDYYYIYLGELPTRIGIVDYEYVHRHATGEYWDPEIMSFSEEKGRGYFSKYCESFQSSGESLGDWFEVFERGE